MPTIHTDVLIVGAGPAGASAAALLSSYGVANILVNKYGGVANSPRAHIVNQRTMEVLRDLGVEDEAKAWATPQEIMGATVWATSLAGMELGRLHTWYTHPYWKGEHDLAAATAVCDLPQDRMEPILLTAATLRGTTYTANTEFVEFEQDADGVTSRLLNRVTGERYEVRSRYLIGADGGRSRIVTQLGLPMEGEMGEGGNINVVFRGDLSHLTEHRPADMFWLIQPGAGHNGLGLGVMRMIQPYKRWMAIWGYDPAQGVPELTDDLGRRIAHQLIGDDSVPVEIESVSIWSTNHMNVLDNMDRRVFVAGDAAHRHSPMHGLGMNTSIQDSFNLAWKLAAVIKGHAGPGLLDTYRDERVPVARHLVDRVSRTLAVVPPMFEALQLPTTVDQATYDAALARLEEPTQHGAQLRRDLDQAIQGTLPIFHTHGMEMNQTYSSPAIVADGEAVPHPERDPEFWYHRTTSPGHHVIHAWVTRNQRAIPLIDLVGKGRFTVLTGVSGGEDWRLAAATARAEFGIDVAVTTIGRGGDYEDSWGTYATNSEVAENGALLVRPDHMIGWRAGDSTDAEHRLRAALTQLLAR